MDHTRLFEGHHGKWLLIPPTNLTTCDTLVKYSVVSATFACTHGESFAGSEVIQNSITEKSSELKAPFVRAHYIFCSPTIPDGRWRVLGSLPQSTCVNCHAARILACYEWPRHGVCLQDLAVGDRYDCFFVGIVFELSNIFLGSIRSISMDCCSPVLLRIDYVQFGLLAKTRFTG